MNREVRIHTADGACHTAHGDPDAIRETLRAGAGVLLTSQPGYVLRCCTAPLYITYPTVGS